MNTRDKTDLIIFAREYIKRNNEVPTTYVTESGEWIKFAEIWNVCKVTGLTKAIDLKPLIAKYGVVK